MKEGIIIFALLLAVVISSVVEAYFDAKKIKKGKMINHGLSAIVRVVLSVLTSLLLVVGFVPITSLVVCILSVYWIMFDTSINVFRGLHPLYIGKTAKTDVFVRGLGFDKTSFIMFKVIVLIISLSVYFNS